MLYFSRLRIAVILSLCVAGVVTALPNMVSGPARAWLGDTLALRPLSLGLDLVGGSSLLFEIDRNAIRKERLDTVEDAVRTALNLERIGYAGLGAGADAVRGTLRDIADLERAGNILAGIPQPLQDGFSPDLEVTVDENGRFALAPTTQARREALDRALVQSLEIVRRRLGESNLTGASVQRQGQDRILVQLPGIDDPGRIRQLIGKTARLAFHLIDTGTDPRQDTPPPGVVFLPGTGEEQDRRHAVRKRVEIPGEELERANAAFDSTYGRWVVNFTFRSRGARRFAAITSERVGEPFAIVLDGKVISAPRINEPILDGSGQISGGFTAASSSDLAILLRAGALPAPLKVIEERTVGPDLGSDSIQAGIVASIAGLVAVAVAIVLFYGLFGGLACVSLVLNLVLAVGVLSMLQATLTLPGIAGLVLTMGMAVDANVLIFERIREESLLGRGVISAIEAGYRRAITSIMDSNVTTILTAILLYVFASGPVRGFAVTLIAGILISMFTAILVTRLMIAIWVRRTRPVLIPL